jgi:hypothetical protein
VNKLTKTQRRYLQLIGDRGRLRRGWGGYGSTLTVRILEERGYLRLQTFPRSKGADDWEASLTLKGKQWYDAQD